MLRRHWVRLLLLVVLAFVVLLVGTVANAARTCTDPRFGLPVSCDSGWVLALAALVLVVGLGAEIVVAVRRRMGSRPCPRCGHRVPNGTLACGHCDFDFAAVAP